MLDKKINTLLFTHDCVIVPGLGGFIASPSSAKHNAIQHRFIPPARIIAFNVYLSQNDGLLANFISAEENISFSEAMSIVERYVERCFMELEAGKKVTVTDVGQLYYDSEKNIQFNPDETVLHSFDSFGLSSLRAVPVVSDVKKENIFFSPLRESARKEKPRKAAKQRKASSMPGNRYINAGLFAGALLWAVFNVYLIAPGNFNLSSLNPFESRIRPVPPADTVKQAEVSPQNIAPPVPVFSEIEKEITPPAVEEKIVDAPAEKAAENISAAKATDINGSYFTVVGVFNLKGNAEKMLARLRDSGYPSSGSIERENKPVIVYAGQHLQKADAFESIQRLKEQGIDAWVFAR